MKNPIKNPTPLISCPEGMTNEELEEKSNKELDEESNEELDEEYYDEDANEDCSNIPIYFKYLYNLDFEEYNNILLIFYNAFAI